MRLLDTYATNTGSTIDKPFIFTKYFPLPVEKYITLQTQTPYDSRNYKYWQEVIDILKPFLEKNNIYIIHTGLKDDKKYNNVIDFLGQTNINQFAYIIKNSMLHLGADSFGVHLASYYNKPIVSLYSISNPNVAGPHFGDSNLHKLIKCYENIGNKKPSYSQTEDPKSIDTIKPEIIAKYVLELLNIDDVLKYETTYIGNQYGNLVIESIPSVILPQHIFPNILLNIRYDYVNEINEKDYICTLNNLNIRKCALITDKPIEIEKFLQLKDNISNIFYDVTYADINLDFINKVKFYGIKIDFIFHKSKNKDEQHLNNKKFEIIDLPEQLNIIEFPEKPLDQIKSSKFYKSKKFIFTNDNIYLSKAAYLENKPIDLTNDLNIKQSIDSITDIDMLIKEDGDYCLFYK